MLSRQGVRLVLKPSLLVSTSAVAEVRPLQPYRQVCHSMRHIASAHGNFDLIRPQTYCLSTSRSAGHNKWSNIRHGKAKIDQMRSITIQKCCKVLNKAIRLGKGDLDPKFNTALAKALALCQEKQVPKETIQRQFDRAKNAKMVQELLIVKGPSATTFLIDVLTDSRNRSANHARNLIRKAKIPGFTLLDDADSTAFFQARSTVVVARDPSKVVKEQDADITATNTKTHPDAARSDEGEPVAKHDEPLTYEHAEEIAIEYGAEEVNEIQSDDGYDAYEFVCDQFVMTKLLSVLEGLGHVVLDSNTEYVPTMTANIDNDPDLQDHVDKLYSALDEHEDLEKVYSNIEQAEEIEARAAL